MKNNRMQKSVILNVIGMPLGCLCISGVCLWSVFHFYLLLPGFFRGLFLCFCSLGVMLSMYFLRCGLLRQWEKDSKNWEERGGNRLHWEQRSFKIQLIYRILIVSAVVFSYFLLITKVAAEGGGMWITALIVVLTLEHIMNTKRFADLYHKIKVLDSSSWDEEQWESFLDGKDLSSEKNGEVQAASMNAENR